MFGPTNPFICCQDWSHVLQKWAQHFWQPVRRRRGDPHGRLALFSWKRWIGRRRTVQLQLQQWHLPRRPDWFVENVAQISHCGVGKIYAMLQMDSTFHKMPSSFTSVSDMQHFQNINQLRSRRLTARWRSSCTGSIIVLPILLNLWINLIGPAGRWSSGLKFQAR